MVQYKIQFFINPLFIQHGMVEAKGTTTKKPKGFRPSANDGAG